MQRRGGFKHGRQISRTQAVVSVALAMLGTPRASGVVGSDFLNQGLLETPLFARASDVSIPGSLGTARPNDVSSAGSGTKWAMAAISWATQAAKIAWDYAYERVDGEEAARRLVRATAGTAGGVLLSGGAAMVAAHVANSVHPVANFACTVVGNMVGSWLAEKFTEWLSWLFAEDPMEGYRRACEELGVSESAHRRDIKRAYANCHPDKGSGLTNEEFERKTIAFEIIRATRNRMNTWDDEDD
ncbi:unnamed protein product [Symbiodinium necroappetens]|uniref:J domain-containing protein n=1 Tax=Symbiodinium necroappetens TaxID=1628268 RepID=A0A813CPQ6_9DINO|nr:unnamed protein product [Symbiodinium necroappetens]